MSSAGLEVNGDLQGLLDRVIYRKKIPVKKVKNPLSENEFKLVTGYNCSDYQSTLVGWTPEIPFQIVYYVYPV
jgi:hypothetical protein